MRMSLELLVVAVVILIVAVVVVMIFTGGMENFNSIFGAQSDQQLKVTMCQTACSNYCMIHPGTTADVPWADVPDITYKGTKINSECASLYGGPCKCS